ncbi:MAG: hypothetical protein K2F65_02720 [Eubacterium sp.]|nr:hypothetical protein [Eubacterium sp.]
MPKSLNKVFSAFIGAFLLFGTVLRSFQLFVMTDASTGFINRNRAGTIVLFFVSCLAFILLIPVLLKNKAFKNPFDYSKSRFLFFACAAAGIAMFYDFVFKCVNCYQYMAEVSALRLNYFIPLCLSALSALLCALYFIMMGISFKTDSYDFKSFRYYHMVPVFWNLFVLFSSLTDYNDGIYAEERILHYIVLIFGMLFFIKLIGSMNSDYKKLKSLCFSGFAYGALCFVLAVPRAVAFLFGAELYGADFSAVTYLFISAFAISLSFSMIKLEEE